MAWHSYEFYYKRRRDPKWRDAWISVRDQREAYERKVRRHRIIGSIFSLIIVSQLILITWIYIRFLYEYDIASVEEINQEVLIDFIHFVKAYYQKGWDFVRNFIR